MSGPQENAAGTTSVSSPIGVVLSFAMAGPQYVTNTVLRNALKFTTAPMILAFDGGGKSLWCGTYGKTELWLYRNHRDRVRINPQVSQLTGPGVLAAHWSNLEFCEQAGMPCAHAGSDTIKFVLLEGSQMFFRPGLEEWVMQHSVSFCASGDCSRLPLGWEHAMGSALSVEVPLAVWQSPADPLCHSPQPELGTCANPTQRHATSLQKTLELTDQTMASFTSCKTAWPAMPHDGTFYPLWLLRELRLVMKRRGYEHALERLRQGNVSCFGSKGAPAAVCSMHEALSNMLVLQRYPNLIPTAAPPLLFPLGQLRNISICGEADGLGNAIQGVASREPRVFGVSMQGTQWERKQKEVVQLATALANKTAFTTPLPSQLFSPLTSPDDKRCGDDFTCEPARGSFSDCSRTHATFKQQQHGAPAMTCRPFKRKQPHQQLVACVGDSITGGVGASSSDASYPAVLQKLLGDDYKVANFGAPGTLVQKVHPRGWKDGWFKPYWQTPHFEAFNRSSWDVVVIMMGTNDVKHEWFPRPCLRGGTGPCAVATELTSLINLARERGASRVFVVLPPPALREAAFSITQSQVNANLQQVLRSAAEANRHLLAQPPIDVFSALGGAIQYHGPWECSLLNPAKPHCAFFSCDRTHPSDLGYRAIARLVHEAIVRAG